ncbi:MAG: hypothetical protein U0K68_08315 [Agathobacter sp.]|nr:hypothetical protein [Agathobacter sp.]
MTEKVCKRIYISIIRGRNKGVKGENTNKKIRGLRQNVEGKIDNALRATVELLEDVANYYFRNLKY